MIQLSHVKQESIHIFHYFLFRAANLASRSVNLASSALLLFSGCFAFSFSLIDVCASFVFLTVPRAVAISLSDFVAGAVSADSSGAGKGPSAAACGFGEGI